MATKRKEKVKPLFTQQNTKVATHDSLPVPVEVLRPSAILIRTKRYKTPEEMQPVIQSYFDKCEREQSWYTVEGLALHLGFSSTESLREYEKGEGYEPYHDMMKMAKLKIQEQRVRAVQSGEVNAIAGIFLLSNCHKQDYQRDPESIIDERWTGVVINRNKVIKERGEEKNNGETGV